MREVVVRSYCDRCLTELGHHEPATETFTVALAPGERPGKPHLVEMCERHGKELYELLALVVEQGIPTEKLAPASSDRPAARPGRGGPIPSTCPVPGCGQELANRGSLSAHVRNVHKTTLTVLAGGTPRKPSTPATCPVCGFVAASGTGLSAHTRATHSPEELTPAPETPEELLPVGVAAERAGVTRKSLESAVRRDRIPSARTPDGIRIRPADLAAWVAKRQAGHQEEMSL